MLRLKVNLDISYFCTTCMCDVPYFIVLNSIYSVSKHGSVLHKVIASSTVTVFPLLISKKTVTRISLMYGAGIGHWQ